YKSDGTEAGTQLVSDLDVSNPFPSAFLVFKDDLYFHATQENKQQLFRTDGTKEGTDFLVTLTDLWVNFRGSNIIFLVDENVFYCSTNQLEINLCYVSDGQPAGTHLVSSSFAAFSIDNGKLIGSGWYAPMG